MSDQSVSVIIPAYRAASTIARAIDSIIAQTQNVEEIIVIDDGSPDALAAAVARYQPRVTYIRQENAGVAAARNRGIDASSGAFIAFLDADDYWEPDKIRRQLEIFDRHPTVSLVAGEYFTQSPGETKVPARVFEPSISDKAIRARGSQIIDLAAATWTGTVMIRRGAIGSLRFVTDLRQAEDRDLWIRLLRDCTAYFSSTPLATAVLEPHSLSRGDTDRCYGQMIKVLGRHDDLLKPAERREKLAEVYRGWAGTHLADGYPLSAIHPAHKRLRLQPRSAQAWWVLAKSVACTIRHPRSKAPDRSAKRDVPPDDSDLRRRYTEDRESANRLRQSSERDRVKHYPEIDANRRREITLTEQTKSVAIHRLLRGWLHPASAFLEIGSGQSLALSFADSAAQSISMDVVECRDALPPTPPDNFSHLVVDSYKVALRVGSIDVAVARDLLQRLHPDDAPARLSELRRALAPGGVLLCMTPHRASGPWDASRGFSDEPRALHLKEYSIEELRALLRRAGFDRMRVRGRFAGRLVAIPFPVVLMIERAVLSLKRDRQMKLSRRAPFRWLMTDCIIDAWVEPAKASEYVPRVQCAVETRLREVAS